MSEIQVKLGGDNSAFRGMLDQSEAAVGKFGRSMADLLPALSGAAILGFFKTVIDKASALQDLSDRLGVATDELQAFQFAVTQAGGTAEQANQIWDKARKAFDGLAAGTPEVVKQFEKLHITSADIIGLDYPQSLELTVKAYKNCADEAGAYEAFVSTLGEKSSPKLMAALMNLADVGFPALIQALIEAGGMIDKHAIKKLDDFGDRMDALKSRMIGWGAGIFDIVDKSMQGLGALASSVVNVFEGRGFSDGLGALAPKADAAVKAISKIPPVVRDIAAEQAKITKAQAAETKAAQEELDTVNKIVDAKNDVIKAAMKRAQAEGKVTSEMEDQLTAIQKMAGAGQGGFKAGPGGGGEGKVSLSALENALENAKNAVKSAEKNINAESGARDMIEAKALVEQMEKNVSTAKSQQGIGSPIEVNISGLDFSALSKVADQALGSKQQNAMDAEMAKISKNTELTYKQIQNVMKVLEPLLKE